jgi:hypothetical protein
MALRARIPKLEALGEALALFSFVMLYIWKLRPAHSGLVVLVPAFTIATHAGRRETARQLGFGWKEFRGSLPVLPWVAATALLLLAAGALAGTTRVITPGHAAWDLGAHLIRGFLQQYLLNAFLANRLAEWIGSPESRAVALAAAALFSLAHLPNWSLMLLGHKKNILV